MIKKRWRMTCGECQARWDVNEHDPGAIKCPTCKARLAMGFKSEMSRILEHSEQQRWNIIHGLIGYMDRHNMHLDLYLEGTAEMGYEDLPMIAGKWNPKKASKVYNYLERCDD
jgi:hypothetical protein